VPKAWREFRRGPGGSSLLFPLRVFRRDRAAARNQIFGRGRSLDGDGTEGGGADGIPGRSDLPQSVQRGRCSRRAARVRVLTRQALVSHRCMARIAKLLAAIVVKLQDLTRGEGA